jgi:hypothetical protein
VAGPEHELGESKELEGEVTAGTGKDAEDQAPNSASDASQDAQKGSQDAQKLADSVVKESGG